MRFRITNSGYMFDKYLLYGAWAVILLGLFAIFYINNFDFNYKLYYKCEKDICPNPILKHNWVPDALPCKIKTAFVSKDCIDVCREDWCKQDFLTRGEYGKKPVNYNLFFVPFVIGILALTVYLNHRIYNKGKKFDLGLKDMYPRLSKVFDENESDKNNRNN